MRDVYFEREFLEKMATMVEETKWALYSGGYEMTSDEASRVVTQRLYKGLQAILDTPVKGEEKIYE